MKNKFIKAIAMVFVSLTLALGCISLVGCGEEETTQVKSISLNKNTLTLMENEAETLVVTLDPNGATITWASSDNTKVVVDQNGKVTGISVTTTPVIVTATAGDKSATCAVTVTQYVPSYELSPSISFSADTLTSGTYTNDIELYSGVMWVTADDSKKENDPTKNNGDIKIEDKGRDFNGTEFTKSIKLNGKGSAENRSIKLVLNKGAKIKLYCKTGSEGTARTVNLYNSDYTTIIDGQTFTINIEKDPKELVVKQAGTYYIGTETGTLSIYGINIYYEI